VQEKNQRETHSRVIMTMLDITMRYFVDW